MSGLTMADSRSMTNSKPSCEMSVMYLLGAIFALARSLWEGRVGNVVNKVEHANHLVGKRARQEEVEVMSVLVSGR